MDVLYFCHWGYLSTEENFLLEKIKTAFLDIYKDENLKVRILDLKSSEPTKESFLLLFGENINSEDYKDSFTVWRTKQLKELQVDNSLKRQLFSLLKVISEEIKIKQNQSLIVEKNNVSFGLGGEIKISEQELQYLKDLKDFLNGETIIIRKKDVEIKIEG